MPVKPIDHECDGKNRPWSKEDCGMCGDGTMKVAKLSKDAYQIPNELPLYTENYLKLVGERDVARALLKIINDLCKLEEQQTLFVNTVMILTKNYDKGDLTKGAEQRKESV